MMALQDAAPYLVGGAVVLTEVALILALRAVTREIRTARADVFRALALLGVSNWIVAGVAGRAGRREP